MTTTKSARRWRLATAAALAVGGLLAAAAPAQAQGLSTDRWLGGDRHATAASVSGAAFAAGTPAVVVVNGGSAPDALAAAPLAASLRAPLLTVSADQVPGATRAELTRLRPGTVWVVGGAVAVGEGVVEQLRGLAGGGGDAVRRVSGSTRYETAARVAQAQPAGASGEVYVASGEGFADALAAGAAGAAKGAPLLLTRRGDLPEETRQALLATSPARITVVGGSSVVSDAVQAQLESGWPGKVRRISGDDRYDTAARVTRDLTGSAPHVLLASGANFPDALAGAALGRPLLLTRPDCLPQATADAYAALGTTAVTGLGGTGVLSDAALAGTVCAALPAPAPAGSATPRPSSGGSSSGSVGGSASASSPPVGSSGGSAYYANCAAVRSAGKAPLYRGQPGYRAGLDRDGDGVACE